MGQALLGLIPLALAAALSTVPVTAAIFILLSDGRRRSGLAFLGATLLGTFVLVSPGDPGEPGNARVGRASTTPSSLGWRS